MNRQRTNPRSKKKKKKKKESSKVKTSLTMVSLEKDDEGSLFFFSSFSLCLRCSVSLKRLSTVKISSSSPFRVVEVAKLRSCWSWSFFFFFSSSFDVEGGNPFWETRQKKAPQLDDDDEDNNNDKDNDEDDEDDDDNNNEDGEEAFILLSGAEGMPCSAWWYIRW
ncbi:hypothetical protein TRV_00464 [Trichophyton verrucosum HKI 0517]|uniref:Uncharacterized protein n=1 Tax=Trichophyton verrucosum (strain HKI 0517) TaxID=663202 RepID=D4D070_TRIVH|nr:uncharacterized protein TRV_00464 [Trichophyton verrucosum HKI 0517]EFE44792.1 hypothetical protein TRV_00464 [Trichophyton verrucosum HKI 0517]